MSDRLYHFLVSSAVSRGTGLKLGGNVPVMNPALAIPGPIMRGDHRGLEARAPLEEDVTRVSASLHPENPLDYLKLGDKQRRSLADDSIDLLKEQYNPRIEDASEATKVGLQNDLARSINVVKNPANFTDRRSIRLQAGLAKQMKYDALLHHYADIAVPLDDNVSNIESMAYKPRGRADFRNLLR